MGVEPLGVTLDHFFEMSKGVVVLRRNKGNGTIVQDFEVFFFHGPSVRWSNPYMSESAAGLTADVTTFWTSGLKLKAPITTRRASSSLNALTVTFTGTT